jgi:hypothetical protein
MKVWIPCALAALVLAACSGGGTKAAKPPAEGSGASDDDVDTRPAPDREDQPPPDQGARLRPPEDRLPPAMPDRPPQVFPPAWKAVGVGQKISFAVTAIDQDLDETRVDVTSMPATAKFDALTQTVTWTPSKKDLPKATFVLHVSNLDADGKETASWDQTFEIAVLKKKQPVPVAARQNALAETVLTIHETARLAKVNKDWPLDKMLVRAAELLRATLPPEAQKKLGKLDKKALFKSFLVAYAATQENPRLDPTAKAFDKKVFGDPRAWKIVAVRARIDKKWTELRIVYQAVKAPEPVFAMFRVRPTWDTPTVPPEARAYNNKVFLDMVSRQLLDGGKPSEKLLANAKAHGKKVAALVAELLSYDDSKTNPWARAGFSALPTEARLGGGSRRNDDGSYRSGDGWSWSVMKPMPNADGTAQAYVNIAFPGFWTQVVPSPDGTAWAPKCAPKFDPDDASHEAGYEVLCRKPLGLVDLPAMVDGKVTSAKKDAVNLFLDYKKVDEVAQLALDDGRRDLGEENGMTCSQCHIRNFGVHDYSDPAVTDPREGTPRAPNAPIATLDFQIIPTQTWPDFTLEFMKDQECRAQKNLEQFLGKGGLGCPLAP